MKFEEILVAVTLFTGIIWLLDNMFFATARQAKNKQGNLQDPIIVEYAKSFFPVLLIVLILRSFIAEPFKIPSGSMQPTLLEGDHILVNKFAYGIRLPVLGTKLVKVNKPKRGDVIVFRHIDHKDLIKRVVGLPGERITYRAKNLYINGVQVDLSDRELVRNNNGTVAYKQIESLEQIKHSVFTNPDRAIERPPYATDFLIPENSYFVMGDNRDNSLDSRYWGAVNDTAIIGRAVAIWWSWDIMYWPDFLHFWDFNIRWDRAFTAIK